MWREDIVDRSWNVLLHLRELSRFVLIGGWAVYFWTRKLKSRDIDLCIDQDSFYRLQGELQKENVFINRNPRLRKFEARFGDVEVDIYTPFQSNLIIPIDALFQNRWFANIEGHDVAAPEVLLLLKSQAAKERGSSEKGLKDRVDLLSLLLYSDWKPEFLRDLAKIFDAKEELLKVLVRTVKESRVEYKYLGAQYQREGRKIRDIMERLLESRA
jgi:hypothetical protein